MVAAFLAMTAAASASPYASEPISAAERETVVRYEVPRELAATAPRGRAHIWVDGDGGTCRRSPSRARYRDRSACRTVAAAYTRANRAARRTVIMIRGGRYGAFQISGKRTSTKRIVIAAAPGERVVVTGDWMRIGAYDAPAASPSHLTIRNVATGRRGSGETPDNRYGVKVEKGTRHVRLANLRAGSFLIQGAQHIQVVGGRYGPCQASTTDPQICETNKVDAWTGARSKNILIDRVTMHGFNYAPSCVVAGTCHYRSMYVNGVNGFTLRNSRVLNSVFEPWFTISGPEAGNYGNRNILIENNYFGANVHAGAGFGLSFAWCENAAAGVRGYRNVIVRFNSFARGMAIAVPGNPCSLRKFKVYGNIFGRREPSCAHNSRIRFSFNVYAGTLPGRCGAGDVNVGGTTMPFYKRDVLAPMRLDDFKLVGRLRAADNRVPVRIGCPRRDRLGVKRPKNIGRCDAGAHERRRAN